MQSGRLVRPLPDEQKPQPSLLHGLPHPAQCATQSEVSHIRSDIISYQAPFSRQDFDDSDSDTGDNLMTMLLKPSYTAQVRIINTQNGPVFHNEDTFQDSTKSNGSDKVPDSKSEISSLIRAASAKQH